MSHSAVRIKKTKLKSVQDQKRGHIPGVQHGVETITIAIKGIVAGQARGIAVGPADLVDDGFVERIQQDLAERGQRPFQITDERTDVHHVGEAFGT